MRTEQHVDQDGKIEAIVFEPSLEFELRNSLTRDGENESLALMPERAMPLSRRISEVWQEVVGQGHDKVVMLCDHRIRPNLAANILDRGF